MMKSTSHEPFPAARPSSSAEASKAAELARLRSMTVEERMRMALSIHRQLAGFSPKKLER
jgi:hypothetical protein